LVVVRVVVVVPAEVARVLVVMDPRRLPSSASTPHLASGAASSSISGGHSTTSTTTTTTSSSTATFTASASASGSAASGVTPQRRARTLLKNYYALDKSSSTPSVKPEPTNIDHPTFDAVREGKRECARTPGHDDIDTYRLL
jgi:hypothetical protein